MTEHIVVLIPLDPDADIEMMTSSLPINVEAVLQERSEGIHVRMDMRIDDEPNGSLHFLVNHLTDRNRRAESAVFFMTGVHIELTGNVVMLDARPDLIDGLVRELG